MPDELSEREGDARAGRHLEDDEAARLFALHGYAVLDTPAEARFNRITTLLARSLEVTRFAQNPLVLGTPHVRNNAGAPLNTPEGQRLGTLCAIDSKPRALPG